VPAGGSLKVVVSDPAAKEDLPSLARLLGQRVTSTEAHGDGRLTITVEKQIFNCTWGCDEPERATLPFVAANIAATAGHEAIVLCTIEAIRLGTKGRTEGVEAAGLPKRLRVGARGAMLDLASTLSELRAVHGHAAWPGRSTPGMCWLRVFPENDFAPIARSGIETSRASGRSTSTAQGSPPPVPGTTDALVSTPALRGWPSHGQGPQPLWVVPPGVHT